MLLCVWGYGASALELPFDLQEVSDFDRVCAELYVLYVFCVVGGLEIGGLCALGCPLRCCRRSGACVGVCKGDHVCVLGGLHWVVPSP